MQEETRESKSALPRFFTLEMFMFTVTALSGLVLLWSIAVPYRNVAIMVCAGVVFTLSIVVVIRLIMDPDSVRARQSDSMLKLASQTLTCMNDGMDYKAAQKICGLLLPSTAEGFGKLLSTQMAASALEEQTQLATRMELKMLQSQINPHFLFNTINTIASLIRTDPETARKLLREFAVFYRRTLEDSADLIVFAREMEQTKRYFTFEVARFGADRVEMEMRIDPRGKRARQGNLRDPRIEGRGSARVPVGGGRNALPACKKKRRPRGAVLRSDGAPGAIRTRGTRFRRAVLCPLSYGGAFDIVALIVRLAPSLQDALQDA